MYFGKAEGSSVEKWGGFDLEQMEFCGILRSCQTAFRASDKPDNHQQHDPGSTEYFDGGTHLWQPLQSQPFDRSLDRHRVTLTALAFLLSRVQMQLGARIPPRYASLVLEIQNVLGNQIWLAHLQRW